MRRRALPIGLALVLVAALGLAYAAGAARDAGDDGGNSRIKRLVVAGSTDTDAVGDKWVTAECPDGYTVIGGGAQVPHANDTPGVALYWSAPYEDNGVSGWWAAAQDTKRGTRAWLLQVQAICLSGVKDEGGTALAPEVFEPGDE